MASILTLGITEQTNTVRMEIKCVVSVASDGRDNCHDHDHETYIYIQFYFYYVDRIKDELVSIMLRSARSARTPQSLFIVWLKIPLVN